MYNVLTEYHINMIFRMLVSCLCGMAIGFERKNRAKEAGIRTHCIVACASAMMMIISKYGFEDLIQAYTSADVRLDPSRMAQGIVMIMREWKVFLLCLRKKSYIKFRHIA